jgi:hypothetical protein
VAELTAPGFEVREAGGVRLARAGVLGSSGPALHAFSLRTGGESEAPYDTLNLGLASGDREECVRRNRERAWKAAGLGREPFIPRQVHGNRVFVLDERNRDDAFSAAPEADAAITALKGAPLGILVADCVPVIMVDTRTPAIGVAHAGWRGTVLGVAWKTALAMMEAFNSDPAEMVAAIGPCISGNCYEVGEDVREAFVKGVPCGSDILKPAGPGKWLADLREANRRQLIDARIPAPSVGVCPWCTHCETGSFFSARRAGGPTGRMAAVVALA